MGIGLVAAAFAISAEQSRETDRATQTSFWGDKVARLDTAAYDEMFRMRGPEPLPNIVIVEINKDTYPTLGIHGDTIPHSLQAQLLRKLTQAHARIIGLDIVFDSPGEAQEDADLARTIKACGNVILAADFSQSRDAHADELATGSDFPLSAFRDAALAFGPVDLPQDQDGFIRRFDLTETHPSLEDITRDEDYPGFAVRIAAAYRGISNSQLTQQLHAGRFGQDRIRFGPNDMNTYRDGGKVRICFADYPKDCRYVSYQQVIQGDVSPDTFRDKIVLVGDTQEISHDTFLTPLMKTTHSDAAKRPGVEIQANIIHTLLANHYYATYPEARRNALVWLCALLTALLVLRFKPTGGLIATALLLAAIFGLMEVEFRARSVLRTTQIDTAILMAYVGESVYHFVFERRRANQIRSRFGRYVGPRVLEKVADAEYVPYAGGERRYLTVLFSDLQGFTTVSEKLVPEEAVALMNRYLHQMVDIIFKYEGTLDKIMGDGIMAYFSAPTPVPNHELRAVECAIEMQQAMQAWRSVSEQAGLPPLKVRIGIHSGEAVVGDIGSPNQMGYTVIGDTVNTAARLEPLNKEFGTEILISETVQKVLPSSIPTRYLGEIAIRGREESIRAYSVSITPDSSAADSHLDAGGMPVAGSNVSG
jgi:adenylate cyclase